jgi:hypothetical protein
MTARREAVELLVCTDCALVLVNGDDSGVPADRLAEVLAGVGRIGPGVAGCNSSLDLEFSWAACECCGSRLGGARHCVVQLVEVEPGPGQVHGPIVACAECWRRFDLAVLVDAEEWTYGHDCEVPA